MEILTKACKKKKQFYLVENVLSVFFRKTHFELEDEYQGDYYVIRIDYSDGASLSRVKNALKGFNCTANPAINFQGTKVVVNRTMSEKIKKRLLGELTSVFKLKTIPEESEWLEQMHSTAGTYINTIFKMRDFE
jgi:hypothetical protein